MKPAPMKDSVATSERGDMRDKPQVDEAWLAWADAKCLPVRAVVEARLLSNDTRVEIVCVAAQ